MSKTTKPPPDSMLKMDGIRFVPTNCYSPNHWAVKHLVYGFERFDTYDESLARRKAALANQISKSLDLRGRDMLAQKDVLIPIIFRILGLD